MKTWKAIVPPLKIGTIYKSRMGTLIRIDSREPPDSMTGLVLYEGVLVDSSGSKINYARPARYLEDGVSWEGQFIMADDYDLIEEEDVIHSFNWGANWDMKPSGSKSESEEKKKCVCSSRDLFLHGCKCGGK